MKNNIIQKLFSKENLPKTLMVLAVIGLIIYLIVCAKESAKASPKTKEGITQENLPVKGINDVRKIMVEGESESNYLTVTGKECLCQTQYGKPYNGKEVMDKKGKKSCNCDNVPNDDINIIYPYGGVYYGGYGARRYYGGGGGHRPRPHGGGHRGGRR